MNIHQETIFNCSIETVKNDTLKVFRDIAQKADSKDLQRKY